MLGERLERSGVSHDLRIMRTIGAAEQYMVYDTARRIRTSGLANKK